MTSKRPSSTASASAPPDEGTTTPVEAGSKFHNARVSSTTGEVYDNDTFPVQVNVLVPVPSIT